MERFPQDWVGKVMTTNGLVPAYQLGITLPHEHLIVDGWEYTEPNYFNSAYMELSKFTSLGGKTIVDVSSIGRQRDPGFYHRLASRANIFVVAGTGFYKDAWLPSEIYALSMDELTPRMVKEIKEGIGESGVRAGIIGEIGISRRMTKTEANVLAASAKAQNQSGAAISLHFELGTPRSDYQAVLDILERNGADLRRVAVGHILSRPDNLKLCQELVERGCFIEFDLFGQERRQLMDDMMQTHPQVQIASIKGFLEFGMIDHILLSQNVNHVTLMTVNGGDGYAHLLKNIIPLLKSYSITDEQLHTMMVENPARLLAFPTA